MRTKAALLWLGFMVLLLAGLSLTIPVTGATSDADAPDDAGGSDEAPIRVRGGSMEIEAPLGQRWENEEGDREDENKPSFSLELSEFDPDPFDKQLYVRLSSTSAECHVGNPQGTQVVDSALRKGNDRIVWVEYGSDSSKIRAEFKRAKRGPFNFRTKVRPQDEFEKRDGNAVLRAKREGRILAVGVGPGRQGWYCTVPESATSSLLIEICSSEIKHKCG